MEVAPEVGRGVAVSVFVGVPVNASLIGVLVCRIEPDEVRESTSCGVCDPDSLEARLSCVADKGDKPKLMAPLPEIAEVTLTETYVELETDPETLIRDPIAGELL